MQSSQLPSKIQLPFAKNAGGGYVRPIPVTSQIGIVDGAASFNDGFPPLNFQPDGSGGVNPFGQDVNGILNALSSLLWWYSAGGPVPYDSAFQAAIGGYPKGAQVVSAVADALVWRSTTENNVTNPDTGGAGWSSIAQTPAGVILPFVGSGTPAGYLLCPTSQALISAATYPALFAAIGYAWGGSGGNFGVPYFPAGYAAVNTPAGIAAVTHGQVVNHTHNTANVWNYPGVGSTAGGAGANYQISTVTSGNPSPGGADNLAAGMGTQFIVKY